MEPPGVGLALRAAFSDALMYRRRCRLTFALPMHSFTNVGNSLMYCGTWLGEAMSHDGHLHIRRPDSTASPPPGDGS